ncbi:uncharacterized protein [Trachinotus anak]|uniref:uncharacterized protein n=1 Tax=Trachinotus anak TaxID=443729 RepID=UPI0039F1F4C2
MVVLIWATLFFSLRSSNADTALTGASVGGKQLCSTWPYGYCITLPEGEITAEAGLCVVIPCSFTTVYGFTPQNLVWYKCEPAKHRCSDSDMIFHTNKNNMKVQSEFRGRVSLLEPDVSQNNCSIIINDLKESDSGSYQLRVNGDRYGRQDGFTYPPRATVSIKGLSQKPTVMTPPLTEGQQATLTCTAPGFCSGSDPKITWMWRGAGEKDSHITGNITDFKTENLAGFLHRHSSTLTFNASAEHHGTQVTCEVSFTGITTTEETVTLNVTYVKEVRITGDTRVKEGETLNLTCSVESFPPSLIMWNKIPDINIQNGSETNLQNNTLNELQNNTFTDLQNDTLTELQNDSLTELQNNTLNELQNDTFTDLQNDTFTDLQNDTETFLQERSGMATLSITNVTAEDSGLYICIVKQLNNTWKKNVDVKVIYMRQPGITGDTTVQKGDVLNLTCSAESFPPSLITWTKLGFNTNLHNGTDLQSNTGSATLMVPNVTAGDSGQYICTAKHLDMAVTIYADVTVTWFSKILQNSACEVQLEVLTCVCISEGFPLPTIRWPLLKNHTEYSVITSVSNHRVNSTIILTVKDHHNISVECVSSNGNEEAKEKLTTTSEKYDKSKELLKTVSWLQTIIAFLTGVVFSAVFCCFAKKCHRKKQKSSGNLDETLEMVTSQEDPPCTLQMYDGQAVEDGQTHDQEAAEDGTVAAEKTDPELDSEPKDVEYASIDFSLLKRKRPRQAAKIQESTETEYAEIKKEEKEEREDNGGEEGEMLDGKEEEALIEEDEETKDCVLEEEEREDMAVYSNVKDIMGEIECQPVHHLGSDWKISATEQIVLKLLVLETSWKLVVQRGKKYKRKKGGTVSPEQRHSAEITEERGDRKRVCPVEGETDCLKILIRMWVLIWTLLFSVRVSSARGGSSGQRWQHNQEHSITLSQQDIKAEAGLCVVIPCSFTAADDDDVKSVIWYKCDPSTTTCGKPDTPIFSSSNNGNVESGFRGRVSLLEPDLRQKNCSIIINDLKETDSGSYQPRVDGILSVKNDGFTARSRAKVTVTGLSQKPTVMTPPLTEGQQATLTCTAPGLCSGSDPKITWMWRGAGEKDSHITGHITHFKTENLTALMQRHSSTLTFNASAEHHGTQVTCEVSFTGITTTEETVTLNVTYVKDMKISGNTTLEMGDVLNLTCSVNSFPASLIQWTKNGSDKNLMEHRGSAPLIIHNMTADDFGQYICTAKHLNNTLMKNVTLYLKKPVITGVTTVKMGDALNLTCSAGSFRLLDIIWTKLGSNKNLTRETKTILQNDTGTATLLISNVTAEDSGQYVCTAKHVITALTTRSEVTVKFFPRILSSSACEVQSELLTCVCVSEGSPLPTIKWPLLENYTVHSVSTTMTDHTVNSTVILTVKDPSNTVVQCVSSNENGESKENLSIPTNDLKQHDLLTKLLTIVKQPHVINAFLIGVTLSAAMFWLASKCPRKKQRGSGNPAENLELVTAQAVPLIDDGQAVNDDGTHDQEAAVGGASAVEPNEVEYSDIDFSVLKRRGTPEAEETQDPVETEYAEIKKEAVACGQDNGGEEIEVLEDKKEEEVMKGEDKETEQCMLAKEEGGEDVALYSNVNKIMLQTSDLEESR